ncbi:MAG: ATP-binding protein [Halobacteriota archaeon]
MDQSPASERRFKYGGFVVAAIGFVLTRATVLESARPEEGLVQFLVGGALFLALGLGLTVFGIGLAVSTYRRSHVNTIARWCVLGTGAMVLVLGSLYAEGVMGSTDLLRSDVASRVLIGGAVGGVLTGVRTATNERHRRDLSRQRDRLTVMNRILRHEVLNKLNVIQGYAGLGGGHGPVIQRNADHIEGAIEEVGFLTRSATDGSAAVGPTPLEPALERAIAEVRTAYPEADLQVDTVPTDLRVRANERLTVVFAHLLKNAVEHNDAAVPKISVEIDVDDAVVCIDVRDNGPGLPPDQAAVLVERDLPEYDDPTVGFGLTITRLLVEQFGGAVSADTSEPGTTITVELARVTEDGVRRPDSYGVEPRTLGDVTVASLVAGGIMGLVIGGITGKIAIIGALYGVQNMVVGWITHQFHSVVFGVMYAGILSRWQFDWGERRLKTNTLVGIGFGILLWFVAAGIIMSLWLRAVGIDASLPSLDIPNLLAHILWGGLLGVTFTYLSTRGDRGER